MKQIRLLFLITLTLMLINSGHTKDSPFYFDASEMANQYKNQVLKFTDVDVVIDKGKISIIPTKTKGRGTVRPNEIPNFPPPPLPKIALCLLTIEHWGTSGDDQIEGVFGVKNIFYGNGGNDILLGSECDDVFYAYDQMNPAENKGTSTVTGNGGSDTLNTQRLFKATFTDYDPNKDVLNIIP